MGGSTVHTVTSESEAPQDASEVLLNKSNTLKIRLDPMDFDYFESVIRSDDESNGDQPRWRYVSLLQKYFICMSIKLFKTWISILHYSQ